MITNYFKFYLNEKTLIVFLHLSTLYECILYVYICMPKYISVIVQKSKVNLLESFSLFSIRTSEQT